MRFAALLLATCLGAAACPGPGGDPPPPPPRAKAPPAATPAPARPAAGTTDRQQVLNGVRDVVAEVLGIAPAEVDVRAPLSKQKVSADELDTVEIILRVEEAFGVEIPDEDVSGPNGEIPTDLSVEKLAEVVAARKSRK